MIQMNFEDYIKPELLVLIPVLYLVGVAIKKSNLNDRWIPIVLGAAGVVLAGLYIFATTDMSGGKDAVMAVFVALTQGILTAGASVYANQIYKQITKGGEEKNDNE